MLQIRAHAWKTLLATVKSLHLLYMHCPILAFCLHFTYPCDSFIGKLSLIFISAVQVSSQPWLQSFKRNYLATRTAWSITLPPAWNIWIYSGYRNNDLQLLFFSFFFPPSSLVSLFLHPIIFSLFFGMSNLEEPALFLFSLNMLRTLCMK